jgi:uncharacterized membrane protein
MNKAIIAPIVAAVLMLIKQLFGIELPSEAVDTITNGVLAIVMLAGIFIDPRKASPTPSEVEDIQQNHGGGESKNGGGGEH